MKPYYQSDNGVLYHGDCLEIIPQLEPVDLVVTSPPYNLSFGVTSMGHWNSTWKTSKIQNGYGEHRDDLPYDEYVKWQKKILSLLWSKLSENGAIYYNHKPRPQHGVLQIPTIFFDGIPIRQIVIWDRCAGVNFSKSHYMPMCEWIIIAAKPMFRLKDRSVSKAVDVWRFPPERDNKHPAPFPVELPMRILTTTPNGVVLDPYMGSGTTAVACEKHQRRWIGIEISEKYCELAAKRIEAETRQLKLF